MNRKLLSLLVAAALLVLAGCSAGLTQGDAENTDTAATEQGTSAPETTEAVGNTVDSGSQEWPEEFAQWDVPTIDGATITSSTNVSAGSDGLAQGLNVIVNLVGVSQEDFDAYLEALEVNGFTENAEESLAGVMLVYNRDAIEMLLMYTAGTTTITVNNADAESEQAANAGGDAEWPETLSVIPVFTRGAFRDTIAMGGNMYVITFLEVTEEDVDWYRGELASAGFESQANQDTEGYYKVDAAKAYSVGFTYEDGTLQIIALFGTY